MDYCDSNQYNDAHLIAPPCTKSADIPASFMGRYSRNGRALESCEFVETRFEACGDLAHGVSDFCMALTCKDDLSEETVLQRCHVGLLQTPDAVSSKEAIWVTCRAAELLQWDQPTLPMQAIEAR